VFSSTTYELLRRAFEVPSKQFVNFRFTIPQPINTFTFIETNSSSTMLWKEYSGPFRQGRPLLFTDAQYSRSSLARRCDCST
jgi:hypothetical protein